MNEVFLDTETTGLSFKEGHKVVEIACIETKDLIPTGKVFHKLINPKRSMPIMFSKYIVSKFLIRIFNKLIEAFSLKIIFYFNSSNIE